MLGSSRDDKSLHQMAHDKRHHLLDLFKQVRVQRLRVNYRRGILEAPRHKQRLRTMTVGKCQIACMADLSTICKAKLAQQPHRIVWIIRIHPFCEGGDLFKRNVFECLAAREGVPARRRRLQVHVAQLRDGHQVVRLRLADVVAPLHRRRLDRQRSDVQPHDGFLADHDPIRLRHNGRCGLVFDFVNPRRF